MALILRGIQVLAFCWSFYIVLQVAYGKCVICSSSTNQNCIANVSHSDFTYEFCPKWCFTRVHTNGTVERGCVEETTESTVDKQCIAPDCYYCDASKGTCNKHTICKQCDSSKDPDCAQTDVNIDKYNSVCLSSDTQCLAMVRSNDKHVERRCAINSDTAGDLTKLCLDNNCNAGIYPAERRRCYQCVGSSACANLADNTDIKSVPCLLYDANEMCYTYGTSNTNMTRGCRSDVESLKTDGPCDGATPSSDCATCKQDNCNARTYERDQKQLCLQCQKDNTDGSTTSAATTPSTASSTTSAPKAARDGETSEVTENTKATESSVTESKETESSATESSATDCSVAKNCKTKLLYTQDDACYSQVKDGITHYGCLYDRNETMLGECNTVNTCNTCNSGDGCNEKGTAASEFTCIRCRSDVNDDCRTKAKDMAGATCSNEVSDASTAECYYGTWNNVLIRGCMVDADPRMQRTCNDASTNQCIKCQGVNCNTADVNGSNTLKLTPLAFIAVVCGIAINRWQS